MVILFSYKGDMDKNALRDEIVKRYNHIMQNTIDVRLFYDNCRPYLDNNKEISITHTSLDNTNRIEVVAISDKPVGVDIERSDRKVHYDIAKRYFEQDEIAYIDGDNSRFLEIWQKKEAYGKSKKIGIYKGSVINIKDFKTYHIFKGYNIVLYSQDDDVFFVTI